MDMNIVIKILGEPFSKEILENQNKSYILNYSKPSFIGINGTQIRLVIKNRKLTRIVMENSFDYGFYLCNEVKCPVYINREDYDKYIPK